MKVILVGNLCNRARGKPQVVSRQVGSPAANQKKVQGSNKADENAAVRRQADRQQGASRQEEK
jgi:hypothetical protein